MLKHLLKQRWFLNKHQKALSSHSQRLLSSKDWNLEYWKVFFKGSSSSEYLFPVESCHSQTDRSHGKFPHPNFSHPGFLTFSLKQCLKNFQSKQYSRIPNKNSLVKAEEDSTNPVFLNEDICLKFHPHIRSEENRELSILKTLKGSSCIPELLGFWKIDKHCFAVCTRTVKSSKNAWDIFCDQIKNGKTEAAEKLLFEIGSNLATVHKELKAHFPSDHSLQGRKECYYNSLSLALKSLNLKLHLDATLLPDIQWIHGDMHLGQVLCSSSGDKFLSFLDFEGAPLESSFERKQLKSPFHDIAGILRSLDYAWLMHNSTLSQGVQKKLENTLLQGYFGCTPESDIRFIIKIYCLQRALYEHSYERESRPHMCWIPEKGLQNLISELNSRNFS